MLNLYTSKKQTIVLALSNNILQAHFRNLCNKLDVIILYSLNNGENLFEIVDTYKPEFILVDSELSNCSRSDFLKLWSTRNYKSKAIIYSQTEDMSYFESFLTSNTFAYIHQDCSELELTSFLKSVFDGKRIIFSRVPSERSNYKRTSLNYPTCLTLREREVWKLIEKNCTEKEIASSLMISFYTVKAHKNNISKKLGIKNKERLSKFINSYQSI